LPMEKGNCVEWVMIGEGMDRAGHPDICVDVQPWTCV
jgi:hypothetical protein